MLSAMDQGRIQEAVRQAEAGTSGEIVCMLAKEVSHYPEVALAWASVIALAVPAIGLTLGVHPLTLAADAAGVWMVAQAGAVEGEITLALLVYAVLQTALFILSFLIFEIPAVRRAATPKFLKKHKVDRLAAQQFAAVGARATASETGVLILVAVDDRQVRIMAHQALHGKADDAAWAAAAAAITEAMKAGGDPTSGILRAVDICGSVLKAHFPATDGGGENLFSDHPVEV